MDSLRWILLAIGIVVVIGVYFWSRQSTQRRTEPRFSQQDFDEQPISEEEDWEVRPVERREYREPVQEPLFEADDDDLAITAEAEPLEIDPGLEAQLKGLEQALVNDVDEQPRSAPAKQQPTPVPPAVEEKIIAFYLVAPRGQPFAGSAVSRAFANQELRFGDMNIFHRLSDNTDTPVFSIANLVEPGTFDPEQMAAASTPGLSLFMRLPGPNAPLQAFDDLADTAQALADELNGELRDHTRSLVTSQTLDSLRADVAEYARRQHLPT